MKKNASNSLKTVIYVLQVMVPFVNEANGPQYHKNSFKRKIKKSYTKQNKQGNLRNLAQTL